MAYSIGFLPERVSQEISSAQVIIDLRSCIKELVENSLDAGATNIEIRLVESGIKSIEVRDNGSGIEESNFEDLATRGSTSKIRDMDDLFSNLSTFGFRGEALNSLCSLSDVTVLTRINTQNVGLLLAFDPQGRLIDRTLKARDVGTTVTCKNIFHNIPIRQKEFCNTIKQQLSSAVTLLQAYAVIRGDVRLILTNSTARGEKQTLLSTSGNVSSLLESFGRIFGKKIEQEMLCVEYTGFTNYTKPRLGNSSWSVEGFISKPQAGRKSKDIQIFYVNSRPIDSPRNISRVINEVFRQFSSRNYPAFVLNFKINTRNVDVNLTPDKRMIFLREESTIAEALKGYLAEKVLVPLETSFYQQTLYQGSQNGLTASTFGKKLSAVESKSGSQVGSKKCANEENKESSSDSTYPIPPPSTSKPLSTSDSILPTSRSPNLKRNSSMLIQTRDTPSMDDPALIHSCVGNHNDDDDQTKCSPDEANSSENNIFTGLYTKKVKFHHYSSDFPTASEHTSSPQGFTASFDSSPQHLKSLENKMQGQEDGNSLVFINVSPRVVKEDAFDSSLHSIKTGKNDVDSSSFKDAALSTSSGSEVVYTNDSLQRIIASPSLSNANHINPLQQGFPQTSLMQTVKVNLLSEDGTASYQTVLWSKEDSCSNESASSTGPFNIAQASNSPIQSLPSMLSSEASSPFVEQNKSAASVSSPDTAKSAEYSTCPNEENIKDSLSSSQSAVESPLQQEVVVRKALIGTLRLNQVYQQNFPDSNLEIGSKPSFLEERLGYSAESLPPGGLVAKSGNTSCALSPAIEDGKRLLFWEESRVSDSDTISRAREHVFAAYRKLFPHSAAASAAELPNRHQAISNKQAIEKEVFHSCCSSGEVTDSSTKPHSHSSTAANMRFDKNFFSRMKIIGQFNHGFIIALLPRATGSLNFSSVFIIDQHAADEKARFERLNEMSLLRVQPLMHPLKLELTPAQICIAESHLRILRLNGFRLRFEHDTKNGLKYAKLLTMPSSQGVMFSTADVASLIDSLHESSSVWSDLSIEKRLDLLGGAAHTGDSTTQNEEQSITQKESTEDVDNSQSFIMTWKDQTSCDSIYLNDGSDIPGELVENELLKKQIAASQSGLWNQACGVPRPHRVWRILASKACRSAIMIGDVLDARKMAEVVHKMAQLNHPWNCPHGRPTMRHLANIESLLE